MGKKKNTHTTEEGIQKRFDTFTKRTLKNLIRTELKSYIRASGRNETASLDEMDNVAAPAPYRMLRRSK